MIQNRIDDFMINPTIIKRIIKGEGKQIEYAANDDVGAYVEIVGIEGKTYFHDFHDGAGHRIAEVNEEEINKAFPYGFGLNLKLIKKGVLA